MPAKAECVDLRSLSKMAGYGQAESQEDKEKGRQADKETGRQGDKE